jgi:hypothetical protein
MPSLATIKLKMEFHHKSIKLFIISLEEIYNKMQQLQNIVLDIQVLMATGK